MKAARFAKVRQWGGALVRPRLHRQLSDGASKSLTVVVAPAGYGKSVLLADWTSTLDIPVVWLALEPQDNDAGHLFRSIVTAFEDGVPNRFSSIEDRLDFVTPASAPQLISEWAEQLKGLGQMVLVVDDLHVLSDSAAILAAERLLESMPSGIQVCVASRHDPVFGVSSLRVAGRLTEVRQRDLVLTIEELSSLLESSGIPLTDGSVESLQRRTEGWFAAVRLALISMQRSDNPESVVRELGGTQRFIAEYLLQEVLAEMDPEMEDFLRRTSILEEVNGEVGEVLTGRVDGGLILEELSAAGEFTSRTRSGWYRYHSLLRDLLRANLRQSDADLYLRLNRRAADFWWQRGDFVKAINHAIDARETDQATDWLGEAARSLASTGNAASVVELSGRLLKMTTKPNRLLITTRMWALYNISAEPEETDRLMDLLEEMLAAEQPTDSTEDSPNGGDPRSYDDPSALPWLQGLKARAHGDLDGLLALDQPGNLPSPVGRLEAWVGEGFLWCERYPEAETLFDTFHEHAHADGYVPSMVHELGIRAFALTGRGQFSQAEALVAEASELTDRFGLENMIASLYAQLTKGWLLWEQGDLQGAESALVASQEFADLTGDVPISVQHALIRSRTRWSLGDTDGSHALLEAIKTTSTGRVVVGHFRDRLAMARATLEMLEGDYAGASRWIPDWRDRLVSGRERAREHTVLSRLRVGIGDTKNLREPTLVRRGGPTALQLIEEAKLTSALALKEGRKERATSALATAMREAMAVGATQRVLDERSNFALIYADASEVAGFTQQQMPGLAPPSGPKPSPPWFVEQLTQREIEVLEQLPTQLTYPEIAGVLYISGNTVKWHAKAIFRKLAVTRRTDAVNRARLLGLIPE